VDLETDLTTGLQKMLNQASKLLQSNQQLQASLDETQLQIARSEMTPEENVAALPIENLSNGEEFSAAAANIWQAEPSDTRPVTMAVIDVDNFRDFTSAHGVPVADRVLHSIAQIVGSIVRSGDLATRVGGQKFVLMFPKTSARDSTTFVERVRQIVGASQFKRGDEVLTLTVSCALTEALGDDTQETLTARAESTLQEAKRYGRNRTFLHEGKYAAPVVPPRFAIEPRILEV
jgi:diguanylate cyclase